MIINISKVCKNGSSSTQTVTSCFRERKWIRPTVCTINGLLTYLVMHTNWEVTLIQGGSESLHNVCIGGNVCAGFQCSLTMSVGGVWEAEQCLYTYCSTEQIID